MKQIDAKMTNVERDVLMLLLTEVENIFQKSKYDEFVMAMGYWSFSGPNKLEYTSYEDKQKKLFKKIETIFDKYNDAFKLTGNAI